MATTTVSVEVFTFLDPSGELPEEEVLLSVTDRGIAVRTADAAREVCMQWPWPSVLRVKGNTGSEDEMDMVTITVEGAPAGEDEPQRFQFECENHALVTRALTRPSPSKQGGRSPGGMSPRGGDGRGIPSASEKAARKEEDLKRERLGQRPRLKKPAGGPASDDDGGPGGAHRNPAAGRVGTASALPGNPTRGGGGGGAGAAASKLMPNPKKKGRTEMRKVQDWDFVMIFPVTSGGTSRANAKRFCLARYVSTFLGIRVSKLSRNISGLASGLASGVAKVGSAAASTATRGRIGSSSSAPAARAVTEFIDSAHCILRSNRCFLTADGKSAYKARKSMMTFDEIDKIIEGEIDAEKQDVLRQDKLEAMREYMTAEYVAEIGGKEPCTASQYAALCAKTVARRLLMTCGLSSMMKWSCDGDEILVCIRADENDLKAAADKSNYALQTLNQPFNSARAKQLPNVVHQHPNMLQDGMALLRERVDEHELPMMDPGMFRRHWQDGILNTMTKETGHKEVHGYCEGKPYIAPYADYQHDEGCEHMQLLFRHYRNRTGNLTPFRQVDRIRLTMDIMQRHLNVPRLKHSKMMTDAFPLHDKDVISMLQKGWALNKRMHPFWTGMKQPLLLIRNYFGEKIALYFAWLEHYTCSLIFPSVLGLGMQWAPAEGSSLIMFGCAVSIWASRMTEHWKRKNTVLNLAWGTAGFEAAEAERPQFKGVPRYSPVDDQPEVHHAPGKARSRKKQMAMITCFMLMACAVTATWMCLQMKRILSNPEYLGDLGIKLAGFANALQIGVGNYLYGKVAMSLTDWENHRTQSEWEQLLITKTFLFRFLNSYVSFFYIAFGKYLFEQNELQGCDKFIPDSPGFNLAGGNTLHPGQHECYLGCGTVYKPMRCMDELSTQIMMIFVTQIVAGNFSEIVVPFVGRMIKLRKEMKGMAKVRDPKSGKMVRPTAEMLYEQPELEATYSEYRIEKEAFNDYAEMVVQFGFVTLFVVAFPLTPVLALANNVLELHVDAVKLCFGYRRPFPQTASHIGQWATFMNLQSSISVVTNIAIIIFTTSLFNNWSLWKKWALFVFAEHMLLMAKIAVQDTIVDEPEWVQELQARHRLIVQRVFKGMVVEEEDDDDEEGEALVLTIHDNKATFATDTEVDLDELKNRFSALEAEAFTLSSLGRAAAGTVEDVVENTLGFARDGLRMGTGAVVGVAAGVGMVAVTAAETAQSMYRSHQDGELKDDVMERLNGAGQRFTNEAGDMAKMLV